MYQFKWDRMSGLQMQNGFGAMMPVTAKCAVDKSTRQITLLTVNDQSVM